MVKDGFFEIRDSCFEISSNEVAPRTKTTEPNRNRDTELKRRKVESRPYYAIFNCVMRAGFFVILALPH